jgi:hypothetical protein
VLAGARFPLLLLFAFRVLILVPQPPLGDVDDRIRYIAQQLGLDTVMWKYDAFDWQVGDPSITPAVTPAEVQANYDKVIADVAAGTFDTVRAFLPFLFLPVSEN